jgi:hypothetical protein
MDERVKDIIAEINETRSQVSSSQKDEVRVMKAMLNDSSYSVGVYGKNGKESDYSPYKEARTLVSGIVKDAANVSAAEAEELANKYEFTNNEAKIMIGLSKEFINTYIETGRKLPLGGREKSNISILKKVKSERISSFPKKVGVNPDGTNKYETCSGDSIPEHGSLKVYSPAPAWLKK